MIELHGQDIDRYFEFRSVCSKCGRKSVTETRDTCNMTQPNGSRCDGVFEKLDREKGAAA